MISRVIYTVRHGGKKFTVYYYYKMIKTRKIFALRTICQIHFNDRIIGMGAVQRHSADEDDPEKAKILSLKKALHDNPKNIFSKEERKAFYNRVSELTRRNYWR